MKMIEKVLIKNVREILMRSYDNSDNKNPDKLTESIQRSHLYGLMTEQEGVYEMRLLHNN